MTPLFESRFMGTPKRRSVLIMSRAAGAAIFFAILWLAALDADRPPPIRALQAIVPGAAHRGAAAPSPRLTAGVAATVAPYLIPARSAGRSAPVSGAVYELRSFDPPPAPRAIPLRTGVRLAGTLITHTEKRRVAIYVLDLARSDRQLGPFLTRSFADCDAAAVTEDSAVASEPSLTPMVPPRPLRGQPPGCGGVTAFGRFAVDSATLPEIADYIAEQVGTVVIDRTGILGRFNARLTWDGGVPMVQALEEQFGLTLSPATEELDVVVVDSVQGLTPKLRD